MEISVVLLALQLAVATDASAKPLGTTFQKPQVNQSSMSQSAEGKLVKYVIAFTLGLMATGIFLKSLIYTHVDNRFIQFLLSGLSRLLFVFLSLMFISRFRLADFRRLQKRQFVVIPFGILAIGYSIISTNRLIEHQSQQVSYMDNYAFMFQCFNVGLFEEIFVRVLLFSVVMRLTRPSTDSLLIRQVLMTSVAFALLHSTNFFNPNYDVIGVVIQMLFAVVAGIVLQSIFIRFSNVWVVVFIHTLINYFGMRNSKLFGQQTTVEENSRLVDLVDSMVSISIIALVLLPFCYLMLRQSQRIRLLK